MKIGVEKKHNRLCFNRRADAWFAGPDDGIMESCKRCDSFYNHVRKEHNGNR